MIDPSVSALVPIKSLCGAVEQAARDQGFQQGEIGVRLTDDATIHRINLDHLDHDYPTDVISFDYGSEGKTIQGEMVVSAEMAAAVAAELDWPWEHELLLYVVHGTLHIAGLDDRCGGSRRRMRQAEQRVMLALGIESIVDFCAGETDPATSSGGGHEGRRRRDRRQGGQA